MRAVKGPLAWISSNSRFAQHGSRQLSPAAEASGVGMRVVCSLLPDATTKIKNVFGQPEGQVPVHQPFGGLYGITSKRSGIQA